MAKPQRSPHRITHLLLTTACLTACAGEGDVELEDFDQRAAQQSLPEINISPPEPDDEVIAVLRPGDVFKFGDRYYFARSAGVGPDMTQFRSPHFRTIPALYAGNIVAVRRGGAVSLARLLGLDEDGSIVLVSQDKSPFSHRFDKVRWSAFGPSAGSVRDCADAVAAALDKCMAVTYGALSDCGSSAADELGECASGHDSVVPPTLGGSTPIEFECFLPSNYSLTSVGQTTFHGTDADGFPCIGTGDFFGDISWESTENGCVPVYDGTWTNYEGDCEPPSIGEWEGLGGSDESGHR